MKMTEITNLKIENFENLKGIGIDINFEYFIIKFSNNICQISYPDRHLFLNQYQLDWIFSLLEIFLQYPLIDTNVKVRSSVSVDVLRKIISDFLFLKHRYDDPALQSLPEYNDEIMPFIYALSWFHKAHKVFRIDPTLSFLSLLTALDALNGNNSGSAGADFKCLVRLHNPQITKVQVERLYKKYRCKIVHNGKELGHDIFHLTLERDEDFVTEKMMTEIFTDGQGNLRSKEIKSDNEKSNKEIIGDITYNGLYKIVANCLRGYLSEYVKEKSLAAP